MSSVELRNKTELTSIAGTENIYVQEAGSPFTVKRLLLDTIKTWISGTPIGTVIESAAISAPSGYLVCDGSAVSRSTYASLYNAMTVSKGTCTISIASPGVVTLNTHGLSTGHNIELTTTGALPTGLAINTNYFVIYNDANSFWLAASLANALAGTKINTSGTQSGTHTLRFTPYGIDTSANFKVPDRRAVVGKGVGSQTINTRTKTAPVLGQVEEDQMQKITGQLATVYQNAEFGTKSGVFSGTTGPGAGAVAGAGGSYSYTVDFNSANSADARVSSATSGQTRENSIGMNYYIKY